MKRLIVILVAVLALVGMWMLIKKDETAEPETHTTVLQHIDPVDTTEESEPTSTIAASTTRRNTTARNAQQTSSHDADAAQNAANQNQANADANASASQNAATATDTATTATNSEPTQATDASATTQTTEPTQQATQTSQTDQITQTTTQDTQTTQTTENPGFGQPGNVDFDDTDEQTDQDIGTTTEAGTPEDGDWIPDFSGSDAEGDFFGGEPNHDADTSETPEP